jgi:uncharacterized protein
MNALKAYSIPIQGLKIGIHHFKFAIERDFFVHFEGSPIEVGKIDIDVQLDKRPDMLLWDFELAGYVEAECDRCTAAINLPVGSQRQLIVKFGEAEDHIEDEVVFIHRERSDFNLAEYLYEFAILSLPMTYVYDCEADSAPPCNREVLKFLKNSTDDSKSDSIWDALSGL